MVNKIVEGEMCFEDKLLSKFSMIKKKIFEKTHGVSILRANYEKWYLPLVCHYLRDRENKGISTYIVGLSGGVGAGKSVLSVILSVSLEILGYKVLAFSIDDYYKDVDARDKWRARHASNPFYKYRGLFGMHKVRELRKVLLDLSLGKKETILHFDKGLLGGKGDVDKRLAVDTCQDFVIFDGWCIGMPSFTIDEFLLGVNSTPYGRNVWKKLGASRSDLLDVLHELDKYQAVWDLCDSSLLLLAKDVKWISRWRMEQEHRLISFEGKGKGMGDSQVRGFVISFMPFILQFYHFIEVGEIGDIFEIVLKLNKKHVPVAINFYNN